MCVCISVCVYIYTYIFKWNYLYLNLYLVLSGYHQISFVSIFCVSSCQSLICIGETTWKSLHMPKQVQLFQRLVYQMHQFVDHLSNSWLGLLL